LHGLGGYPEPTEIPKVERDQLVFKLDGVEFAADRLGWIIEEEFKAGGRCKMVRSKR
jgi:hypothetical protein